MAFVPVAWRVSGSISSFPSAPVAFLRLLPIEPCLFLTVLLPLALQDIGKSSNDLLARDYPLGATSLEVKTKAPSGVAFTVRGSKDAASNAINADLEAKFNGWKQGYSLTQVRAWLFRWWTLECPWN